MSSTLRGIRIILTVVIYFIFAPFGYAAFFVWSMIPTKRPERRARTFRRAITGGFRVLHDWARFMRLVDHDPRAVQDHTGGEPCVIVANHPTWVDTSAMFSAFPNLVTVVKPWTYDQWWAHRLLAGAGFIRSPGLEGSDLRSLEAVLDSAEKRLAEGVRVLVFPEGTRSPEGSILPFGRLAFEIACRTNVPVYPVAITCDPPWLSKEHPISDFTRENPELRLQPLPPLHPSEVNGCSRTMRKLVQAQLEEALGLSDASPDTQKEIANARYVGIPGQAADRRVSDARGH